MLLIIQKPGPARASKKLSNSLALARRLHRGMMFFLIIIFLLMGGLLGLAAQTVVDVITINPKFVNLILKLGVIDSYFTMMLTFLGDAFAFYNFSPLKL